MATAALARRRRGERLVDALLGALRADVTPFARELGSLGTRRRAEGDNVLAAAEGLRDAVGRQQRDRRYEPACA